MLVSCPFLVSVSFEVSVRSTSRAGPLAMAGPSARCLRLEEGRPSAPALDMCDKWDSCSISLASVFSRTPIGSRVEMGLPGLPSVQLGIRKQVLLGFCLCMDTRTLGPKTSSLCGIPEPPFLIPPFSIFLWCLLYYFQDLWLRSAERSRKRQVYTIPSTLDVSRDMLVYNSILLLLFSELNES